MSTWNYRVCKKTIDAGDGETELQVGIHEAYYDGEGDDAIWAISVDPVSPTTSDEGNFAEAMVRYNSALHKPTINLDTFKFAERKTTGESDNEEG